MAQELTIFNNAEFGAVRVVEIDGEAYFVGNDVAKALGYKDTFAALKQHVDAEDKLVWQITSAGQRREATVINESGVYSLILRSNLPKAKEFKHWLTSEVIPTIRKHGFYATEEKIEEIVRNPEQFIEHLITAYQRVKIERDELQTTVNALKPKADYCEKILQSPEALNVTVIAKDYGMSAVMFNQLLYSLKIQYLSNKTWVLYQEHVGKGYTVFETFLPKTGYARTQMRWTQKGRMFLYHTLKKHGTVPLIEREESMEKLFGGVA